MDIDGVKKLADYIEGSWADCVRSNDQDVGDLLGLPKPYTVPSKKDKFQEIYYWDTFFANLGLIRQGKIELAQNNTENLLSLCDRFGFVPNGNRTYYLNNSQPAYLSMMVSDVYDVTGDKNWLARSYGILRKEYDFWMRERMTPTGLNQFLHHVKKDKLINVYDTASSRVNLQADDEAGKIFIADHFMVECESGWDCSPRFNNHGKDFVPIDLNCNLYQYELNFARFADILGYDDQEHWLKTADSRKKLINKYCWNEEKKFFYDYNFVSGEHSKIESLAAFHPLWTKLATQQQAQSVAEKLNFFEYEFGLSACRKTDQPTNQWNYPNGWAPLHYIAIAGLTNYNFDQDAQRIAEKYVNLMVRQFEKTGDMWEKYNVVDGSIDVANEDEDGIMPAMMGWSAGVFIYAANYLKLL